MAVRSHLPWPWRAVVAVVLLAVVGGMWWWGFDFGQIFGGWNRKEVEAKLASLETDNGKLKTEVAQLRARNSQLESELAMTAGAQSTLSKQALELMAENTQLKEELSFLQKLVADSNKQGDSRSPGSPSSASATTPGITAFWSSAGATPATSSRGRSRCRRRSSLPAAAAGAGRRC